MPKLAVVGIEGARRKSGAHIPGTNCGWFDRSWLKEVVAEVSPTLTLAIGMS